MGGRRRSVGSSGESLLRFFSSPRADPFLRRRDSLGPTEAIKPSTSSEGDEKKPKRIRRWTRADRSTLVHV